VIFCTEINVFQSFSCRFVFAAVGERGVVTNFCENLVPSRTFPFFRRGTKMKPDRKVQSRRRHQNKLRTKKKKRALKRRLC
jgi:hypothetical protein